MPHTYFSTYPSSQTCPEEAGCSWLPPLPAALTLLARQSRAAQPGGRQRLHLEKVPNWFWYTWFLLTHQLVHDPLTNLSRGWFRLTCWEQCPLTNESQEQISVVTCNLWQVCRNYRWSGDKEVSCDLSMWRSHQLRCTPWRLSQWHWHRQLFSGPIPGYTSWLCA